jgi:hypothetical protein
MKCVLLTSHCCFISLTVCSDLLRQDQYKQTLKKVSIKNCQSRDKGQHWAHDTGRRQTKHINKAQKIQMFHAGDND